MASGSTAHALLRHVKGLYDSGEGSDLTIVCGGREFKVHKWVFEATSPVLRQFVKGKFKEAQEKFDVLELPDDDPDALDALLFFLYNQTCPKTMLQDGVSTLHFAITVYAIADKYEVKELQAQAANVVSKNFSYEDNIDELMETIALVDKVTNIRDDTLWNIIIPVVCEHLDDLLQSTAFVDFLFETREFTVKLIKTLWAANRPQTGAGALLKLYHMGSGRTLGGGSA